MLCSNMASINSHRAVCAQKLAKKLRITKINWTLKTDSIKTQLGRKIYWYILS